MNQVSSTRTQWVNPITFAQAGGQFCNSTDDAGDYSYYSFDSGTSFAAPQMAGACVLLDKKRNAKLTPAMLKAALVGNALSVKGGIDRRTGGLVAERPNAVQGFGRLDLGDALSNQITQTYLEESAWTPFTAAGCGVDSRAHVHAFPAFKLDSRAFLDIFAASTLIAALYRCFPGFQP